MAGEQIRQILAFKLLNEEFALDIDYVREVLKPAEIIPFPHAPDFIEGVINLRGHVITVIDLRKKFNIKARIETPNIRVIICKVNKFIFGIIVDSVSEVIDIKGGMFESAPDLVSSMVQDSYVREIARVGSRVIMVLNLENIIPRKDFERLAKI